MNGVKDRPINNLETGQAMKDTSRLLVYVSLGITLVGVGFFVAFAKWNGLSLHIAPASFVGVMTPLFLAAAFIERAVEVVISPWRDLQADKLSDTADAKRAHAQTKAAAAAATKVVSSAVDASDPAAAGAATMAANAAADAAVTAAQAANDAADEFAQYKGKTKQYAYSIALTMGLLLAYVGVRALSNLYNPPPAASPFQSDNQRLMFNAVDVVLSAALLAGGAGGIHSIVNSVTTFFDSNAQKMQ